MRLKKILSLLVLVCCWLKSEAQDSLRKMPAAKFARVSSIDMQHISLDLRFNRAKKQAYGTASLTFVLKKREEKIQLDAGFLSVKNISLHGKKPLQFLYDGGDKEDGLEVLLDRAYQPGDTLTIQIGYATNYINATDPNNIWGSNGKGIRFLEPSYTEPNRRKQIWAMGEPEGNRYWFPCKDVPADLRTTDFTATVEKNCAVISNGELVAEKNNADGTRTFHWRMDIPYANHLTSFVVGEYKAVRQQYNGIQLNSIGYPDETEAVKATIDRLPDMMQFFTERTGVSYPYKSYSQVFVQELPNWFGNAGFSTITENMVDDEPTHADFFYLWDLTEAEALASQWFGSSISPRSWEDVWISKAFARYFSGLYNEYKNGRDEFLLYQLLYDHNTIYLGDWSAGIRRPIVTGNYVNASSIVGDNYPYFHGASVLHLLRKQLGDAKWDKAIKYYMLSHAGKAVSTADFIKAIQESTGENLRWFFDQWVYTMGHPFFRVEKLYDESKKQLTVNVRQLQKIDSLDEYPQTAFFGGKVLIEIDGAVEERMIEPRFENRYVFDLPSKPLLVNFDYESAWIKELEFKKPAEELLYQVQNDKDILGRQWAIAELMSIALNDSTSPFIKDTIKSVFRDVIQGNSYWRLRFNLLAQLRSLYGSLSSTAAVQIDDATTDLLLHLIKNEKSWLGSAAISFLGMTRDEKYASLYKAYLTDESERVVNAAAIALGKTKSATALAALVQLKDKPSWKNQSLISALNGLKELNDPRAVDIAMNALMDSKAPHWTLATPVWDHRLAAANTLVSLGKTSEAYTVIYKQFTEALEEKNINDIFYNLLQISILADPRGQEAFDNLKSRFKSDNNILSAVEMYQAQYAANSAKRK